ncbi:hypothetical protein LSAT2_029648 [Lamellibrachia satsuma]|nr:hypothetical protein LSAT2_029648 [Lamellibrachia satsuma]
MRIRPHWEEGYMAVIGGACVALIHMRNNRPLVSGLPKYAVGIAIGYGIGHLMFQRKQEKIIEREVYLMDYVRRHPDDFPELVPKKYKEVMEPWYPIRG